MSISVCLSLIFSGLYAQKLKYQSDVEPLLKTANQMSSLPKLELYYSQNVGKNGKPTTESINLKPRIVPVILYVGRAYENFAVQHKEFPTTDTALATLAKAIVWYNKVATDWGVKNDTLSKHISKLEGLKPQWETANKQIVSHIQSLRESIKTNLEKIQLLDNPKSNQLFEKYKNVVLPNEYELADAECSAVLKDLEQKKQQKEQQIQEAVEKKNQQQAQREKENKQKEFLRLQAQCSQENVCPACPLEVAKKFRDAYFAGNVDELVSMVVDYYGDQKVFAGSAINLFAAMTDAEKQKMSLQFRAKTADFKRTQPENAVYWTDKPNEKFFIDKQYKSQYLMVTVFKAINDYDKIDLIKYNGQWKVFRVGGEYGGRSGKSIAAGKFFFDPRILQVGD